MRLNVRIISNRSHDLAQSVARLRNMVILLMIGMEKLRGGMPCVPTTIRKLSKQVMIIQDLHSSSLLGKSQRSILRNLSRQLSSSQRPRLRLAINSISCCCHHISLCSPCLLGLLHIYVLLYSSKEVIIVYRGFLETLPPATLRKKHR